MSELKLQDKPVSDLRAVYARLRQMVADKDELIALQKRLLATERDWSQIQAEQVWPMATLGGYCGRSRQRLTVTASNTHLGSPLNGHPD